MTDGVYNKQIDSILNDWNVQDTYKMCTLQELRQTQKQLTLPFSVGAFNITGGLNVGIMIRTAAIFGAERFFILGKKKYDKRSTVGAHNYIDMVHVPIDFEDETKLPFVNTVIESLGYTPCYIEQGGRDINEVTFVSTPLFRPCLVFGSESNGIPAEVMKGSEDVYSISQRGILRSLNVSAAASIVIHKVANDLMG